MKRYKIVITGDVQGVFYRHYAKKEAESLNLNGWCRNEPDGSVFVVIEGEEKSTEKFLKWLKNGSPLSTVDNVDSIEEKFTGLETRFEVR